MHSLGSVEMNAERRAKEVGKVDDGDEDDYKEEEENTELNDSFFIYLFILLKLNRVETGTMLTDDQTNLHK